MGKKLSELAEQGGEGHLVSTIRDSASTIWLAGLGAFSKAQEEGGKLFDSLVKEGEAVQNRASKSAQEAMSDVKSKATDTWDRLEQVFVDRVARALHSLNVPTKHDIDSLSKRVHDLTKAAEKMTAAMEGAQAKSKSLPAEAAGAKRVGARAPAHQGS
jgi:poly(hydroxyalkanoate) granule-associated protein